MNRLKRTVHDIALGLFINATYGMTQGKITLNNFYVMILMAGAMFMTNKEK